MKKIYYLFAICTLFFALSGSAFALDSINLPAQTLTGKFEMVSDGFVVINQKGVSKSFIRVENRFNVYSDYITYRVSPFSTRTESTPCKVLFLDKFNVRFKTPASNSIELPRYRIKDLDINIK